MNTVFQNKNYNYTTDKSSISKSVNVPENNTDWINSLRARLNELTSLPFGWDGYYGRPVSFDNVTFAANLIEQLYTNDIPHPQLVPGSDGTLQIEWHFNQVDIEIDILKPYKVFAMLSNHRTGHEEEIPLQTDFSILAEWLTELKTNNNPQNTSPALAI